MAFNVALLCFELEQLDGLRYDPDQIFEHFSSREPLAGEAVQSLVEHAFKEIRECLAKTISSDLRYGVAKILNVTNTVHVGSIVLENTHMPSAGQEAIACTILFVKFYQMLPANKYKVTIDLEDLFDSSCTKVHEPFAFKHGRLDNQGLARLARVLDKRFNLDGQIEFIPVIKRGRLYAPHYLLTDDERVVEYEYGASDLAGLLESEDKQQAGQVPGILVGESAPKEATTRPARKLDNIQIIRSMAKEDDKIMLHNLRVLPKQQPNQPTADPIDEMPEDEIW